MYLEPDTISPSSHHTEVAMKHITVLSAVCSRFRYGLSTAVPTRNLLHILVLLLLAITLRVQVNAQSYDEAQGATDFGNPADHHVKIMPQASGVQLTSGERTELSALSPAEREKIERKSQPMTIGVVRSLLMPAVLEKLSPEMQHTNGITVAQGRLLPTADGALVWTSHFSSAGANGLRLFFADGYLPPGCDIIIYSKNGEQHGPYTFGGAIPEYGFWTNSVFSDEVQIEVTMRGPALEDISLIRFAITSVAHNEHQLFEPSHMLDCYEGVNCTYASSFPHIDKLKSAAGGMQWISNNVSLFCSGGLLNDKRSEDFQPFWLTADHCGVTSVAEASSVEAVFDYRTTSCASGTTEAWGKALGATLVKTNSVTDFTLLLLKEKPPTPRTYLGWTTSSPSRGSTLHSVHHPEGKLQKYSRLSKTNRERCLSSDSYYASEVLGGPLFEGSSGALVVNSNAQVVGQNYGRCFEVEDPCDISTYWQLTGRFDRSYKDNGLRYWLNSGGPSTGPSPTIIATAALVFPSTSVGSSNYLPLVIRNASTRFNGLNLETGPATISGPHASEFNLASTSLYIPPQDSNHYFVYFNPTSYGTKTATLTIPHNASNISGPVTVSLTGTAPYPAPSLSSIEPSTGDRLDEVEAHFYGDDFVRNVSQVNLGAGMTAVVTRVESSTHMWAIIKIGGYDTPLGDHEFSVYNPEPGGGTSGSETFTVQNGFPTFVGMIPSSGKPGRTFDVVFTGTKLIPDVSWLHISWPFDNTDVGITVNSITVNSESSLTANITIAPDAVLGERSVVIVNDPPGGGTSEPRTFIVGNTGNLVENAGFENGTASWSFQTNGAGTFAAVPVPGATGIHAGRIVIARQGTNVELFQTGFPLEANQPYRLTFRAYSNTGHDVAASVLRNSQPFPSHGLNNHVFDLGQGWNTFTVPFVATGFAGTTTNTRLRFGLGPYDANGDVYFFDEVSLERLGPGGGAFMSKGNEPEPGALPENYTLSQNYPNPFNPSTQLSWQSPVAGHQTLKVYDVLGNEVATLVDEYKDAGRYETTFDASRLASGIYFYRLRAGTFVETRKMLLVR